MTDTTHAEQHPGFEGEMRWLIVYYSSGGMAELHNVGVFAAETKADAWGGKKGGRDG